MCLCESVCESGARTGNDFQRRSNTKSATPKRITKIDAKHKLKRASLGIIENETWTVVSPISECISVGCQASHEGRTRREHCFSIKILLKPAAIELSRCGVDSIGWENTFDAFAGESDYLTSFDHWNRAECLCFAADARTSTHTCNGCRTRNEWRRKQRPKVYGLEQNKAICYTCYAVAHHKMNINTFRPSRPCVWNRFWKFVCVGFRISHSAVVG